MPCMSMYPIMIRKQDRNCSNSPEDEPSELLRIAGRERYRKGREPCDIFLTIQLNYDIVFSIVRGSSFQSRDWIRLRQIGRAHV